MSICRSCGSEMSDQDSICPSCGAAREQTVAGLEVPRDQQRTDSVFKRTGIFVIPLVLLAGGWIFYSYLQPGVNKVIRNQPVVTQPASYDSNTVSMTAVAFRIDGGDIVFSLDDLRKYRLIRFEYPAKNIVRPVMAYIDPDGRAVTAISISDHCGSTEFEIRDNQIYCAHCPSHWDMRTMEPYACCGTYYPDPIASRVVGNEVRIPKDEVEKWAGRL
jgi:hypothetical protein